MSFSSCYCQYDDDDDVPSETKKKRISLSLQRGEIQVHRCGDDENVSGDGGDCCCCGCGYAGDVCYYPC